MQNLNRFDAVHKNTKQKTSPH